MVYYVDVHKLHGKSSREPFRYLRSLKKSMNPLRTFDIDPEHTRTLARDLAAASHFIAPPEQALPADSTLADFVSTLTAAIGNLTRRSQQLHQDTEHIAQASFALADAAEAQDLSAAHAFDQLQVRQS